MTREPRGFQYPLEPLRRKCGWELQELRLDLARLNQDVSDQLNVVKYHESSLASASKTLSVQHAKAQILFADQQKIAHAYIEWQVNQLKMARALLKQREAERDQTQHNLHRLQKFAEGLEENRGDEIKDYLKVLGKAEITEADDAWLRAIKWRTTQ